MTLSLGFSVDVVSSLRSRTENPLFFIVIKVLTAFPFINNLYKKPGSLHSSLLSFIPLISSSISWQLPFEKEKKKRKIKERKTNIPFTNRAVCEEISRTAESPKW